MTQSAWPFSGQTVSETQFRAWARQAFGSRIYQGLTVSTSTTGRQLTVGAGLATVDGCAYMSDSTVTLDVDANTTGQARRVYAVLRLDPTATPQIQLATVNGPAGGGAATFTQTDTGVYEFPLAYATVTAGQSGGWSSATSSAVMLALPVDVSTLAQLNAWNAEEGRVAHLTDGTEYVRRSGVWKRRPHPAVYQGSVIVDPKGSSSALVVSEKTIRDLLGHAWNINSCSGYVMNGDYGAARVNVEGSDHTGDGLNARLSAARRGIMRFNWIIVDAS